MTPAGQAESTPRELSVARHMALSCASTSVNGNDSRTYVAIGCDARTATYTMSVLTVPLYRWLLPNPCSRAATTSGRERWFSSVRSSASVCVESPTTRPSSGDERHAAGHDLAQPIGFSIEIRFVERRGRRAGPR